MKTARQLVNPDDDRVNAAKRALQAWKEHWLSGMGTLDPNCPIQLWCQFIEQGQDTLKLLCLSRVNHKLSAYAVLEGQFNFDKMPLATVGTRALILLDPSNHALDDVFSSLQQKVTYIGVRKILPKTHKNASHQTRGHDTPCCTRSHYCNTNPFKSTAHSHFTAHSSTSSTGGHLCDKHTS